MTQQPLATLKDREKGIGPAREDLRQLLSLQAIHFVCEAEEEIRILILMILEKSGRMRRKIANVY